MASGLLSRFVSIVSRLVPTGKSASVYQNECQGHFRKIFFFRFSEIYGCLHAVPFPKRGALRDRHERWKRDAMDAKVVRDERTDADGQAVWSWRPDAGVKLAKMIASDGG